MAKTHLHRRQVPLSYFWNKSVDEFLIWMHQNDVPRSAMIKWSSGYVVLEWWCDRECPTT